MLEQLRQLKNAEAWADLIQFAPALPADLTGDDLAKAYLWVSKAHEETASDGPSYRKALAYARLAAASAEPTGFVRTWSLGRIANLASDLGDFAGAMAAGLSFLEALPRHQEAASVAPWVYFHMGRCLYYQRRFRSAVIWFRRAAAEGAGSIRERATLFLVWALAAVGRHAEAASTLPDSLEYLHVSQLMAARAMLYQSSGDSAGARRSAVEALRGFQAGTWAVFDTVQAAELYLILQKAAQHDGRFLEAARWFSESAKVLARWNESLMTLLVPTIGREGGEQVHEADSHRGAAGHKRVGLRGAVG